MQNSDQGTAKKAYTPPQLVVYGDIRDITQALALGAKSDGMGAKTG